MIVTNTTPLINLGKCGKITLLKAIFKKVVIPETVLEELQRKSQSEETLAVQQAIKEQWMMVERVSETTLPQITLLGQGEREAITLASQYKCIFLTDDNFAKSYALFQRIESHGTIYVLTRAVLRKLITKEEAKELLEKMITLGFYVSTKAYVDFINLLNEM